MKFIQRHKVLLLAMMTFLIAVLSYYGFQFYQQQQAKQQAEYYSQFEYYTGKSKIDDYEVIADGQGVVAHWTSTSQEEDKLMKQYNNKKYSYTMNDNKGQHYLLRQHLKTKELPYYSRIRPSDGEYWTLSVYHLSGEKLEFEGELDLYQLVADYDDNLIPIDLGGIFIQNGEEYLPIHAFGSDGDKTLFYNLNKKKFGELKDIDPWKNPRINETKFSKNFNSLLEANGVNVFVPANFALNKNFINNSPMEEQYPAAYKLLRQEGSFGYIMNNYNNADWMKRFLAVYSLLVPKGTNFWEGAEIPAELSTDGQARTVNSEAEFDQYYDLDKAKRLYHEVAD